MFDFKFTVIVDNFQTAGIPITQQHLIWQTTELNNEYSLQYYNIHSGATLKLVLNMRGGPVNTRRGNTLSF